MLTDSMSLSLILRGDVEVEAVEAAAAREAGAANRPRRGGERTRAAMQGGWKLRAESPLRAKSEEQRGARGEAAGEEEP